MKVDHFMYTLSFQFNTNYLSKYISNLFYILVVHKLTSQKYQRTLVPCINHVGSDQHQHFSWAYFVLINLLSMFDDKL